MRMILEPYGPSRSARDLARALGIRRTRRETRFRDREDDVIINWGRSTRRFHNARYINEPEAVALACHKGESFKLFRDGGVPTVPSTEDKMDALVWLRQGHKVYARTLLTANSGRGIEIMRPDDGEYRSVADLVHASLYTRGVECETEYRVHIMGGEVIRVQQKRKRRGNTYGESENEIRNSASGWVFCQDGITLPDGVGDAAVRAVGVLGLDFGGVDVGYAEGGNAVVFEVNTAPGLTGTTLTSYAGQLGRYAREHVGYRGRGNGGHLGADGSSIGDRPAGRRPERAAATDDRGADQ